MLTYLLTYSSRSIWSPDIHLNNLRGFITFIKGEKHFITHLQNSFTLYTYFFFTPRSEKKWVKEQIKTEFMCFYEQK